MDGDRQHQSLTDGAALERDLEALLAVEPSADFVARVRSRVVREAVASVSPLQWRIAAAVAMIAVVGGVTVWRSVSTGPLEPVEPRTVQTAVPPRDGAPAPAPEIPGAAETPAIAHTRPRVAVARRNVREDSPRAAVEMTLPDVIIAENEAQAYAQLRHDLRSARVLPPAPTPRDAVAVDKALEIDPLVIKPIVDVASLE